MQEELERERERERQRKEEAVRKAEAPGDSVEGVGFIV